MPAALEFYKASKTSTQSEGGTTYVDYLSITVDRSGESGAKDFIILAHCNLEVDNVLALMKVRLRFDSDTSTISEVADGLKASGNNTTGSGLYRGMYFPVVRQVNLTAASHTFSLEFAKESGTGAVVAANASIVVIEKSAGTQYAETTTESCDQSNTFQTAAAMTFDPGGNNYVFVWSVENKALDDDDNATNLQFINTTDTVIFSHTDRQATQAQAANDDLYRASGGVGFEAQTGSTTYEIQFKGRSSNDIHCVRNTALVAFPFADFENAYADCNGPGSCATNAKTIHTDGTTFTDTEVVLATQSVNTADHLILAGCEFSNEGPEEGAWRLASAGTNFDSHSWDDRDEDEGTYYQSFHVHGVALTSGTEDFKIQGASSSTQGNREGAINQAYLVVLEIPVASGAALKKTTTETEAIPEEARSILGLIEKTTEPEDITDQARVLLDLVRKTTEDEDITDQARVLLDLTRKTTATEAIEEQGRVLLTLVRKTTEDEEITDQARVIIGLIEKLTETEAITDQARVLLGLVKKTTETEAITEQVRLLFTRTTIETEEIVDQVRVLLDLVRKATETEAITEQVRLLFIRTTTETEEITDQARVLLGLLKKTTETEAIAEQARVVLGAIRRWTETVAIADQERVLLTLVRKTTEDEDITDQARVLLDLVRKTTEPEDITDQARVLLTIVRRATEFETIPDQVRVILGLIRKATELVRIPEEVRVLFGLIRKTTETEEISEQARAFVTVSGATLIKIATSTQQVLDQVRIILTQFSQLISPVICPLYTEITGLTPTFALEFGSPVISMFDSSLDVKTPTYLGAHGTPESECD